MSFIDSALNTFMLAVGAAFPQLAALTAAKQAVVAAIVDLPAQHDRTRLQFVQANSHQLDVLRGFNYDAPDEIKHVLQAQVDAAQRALDNNEHAIQLLNEAIVTAHAAGAGLGLPAGVIDGLMGAGMSGLGLGPLVIVAIGVAAAIVIVAGGWASYEIVTAWEEAEKGKPEIKALQDWEQQVKANLAAGRPLPPKPTTDDRATGTAVDKAVGTVATVAALAIGAWVLINLSKRGVA